MNEVPEAIIRVEGRAGRITLNRPQALNALTHQMALDMERALEAWRDDAAVERVVVDAVGEKAFCAGGDIQDLYRTGKAGDFDYGRRFWADEYRLNALIAGYQKPYVALMDGITMGGGVGISAHGSHRVVTERTMLAMPECGIGLIPDVGGSFILGRAPGKIGTYLGLTGTRLKADGAILTGFADTFVPTDKVAELTQALCKADDVDAVIASFSSSIDAGNLRTLQPEIDLAFESDEPEAILKTLEDASADGNWQEAAAKAMLRASPISLQCACRTIAAARAGGDVRDALTREYRFVSRCMAEGDFLEGIRAQIIDKDRAPHWRHASLAAAKEHAERLLAPLGRGELAI